MAFYFQVVFLGNDVNSENGTILEPLSNIYDPLLVHVFAMKLRIGKCLALAAEEEAKDAEVCTKMLRKADGILQNVLEVSQKVAKEDPALTMEISFLIGNSFKLDLTYMKTLGCKNLC